MIGEHIKKIEVFSSVGKHIAIWVHLGSIPGPVKSDTESPTAYHRSDVSSELC